MRHSDLPQANHEDPPAPPPEPPSVAELIADGEAYLAGGVRFFAIDWAYAVVDALGDKPSSVVIELRGWLDNEEPHLADGLIRRAVDALRKA